MLNLFLKVNFTLLFKFFTNIFDSKKIHNIFLENIID